MNILPSMARAIAPSMARAIAPVGMLLLVAFFGAYSIGQETKESNATQALLPLSTALTAADARRVESVPPVDGDPYAPDKPLAGELEIFGSTRMQQLASLWSEEFRQIHADATFKINCQGSEESFPKLVSGKNVLGLISREVTDEELEKWSKELGTPLSAITVGYDVLALIVHPQNPIRGLSWNSKLGTPLTLSDDKLVAKWGDLGIESPLAERSISHQVLSKKHGLRTVAERVQLPAKGNDDAIHKYESQQDIIDAVAKDVAALGLISAVHCPLNKVRPLAISVDAASFISPMDSLATGKGYPLKRALTLVVVKSEDGSAKQTLVDEFVTYILSRQGQEILSKDGILPLDGSELSAQKEKLGWTVLK
ncbi:MAG: hypothetical protein FJ308_18115 [Planctomycetes bacterium]|nr:hypothetical protein [Planctomycetota bacterium]